MSLPAEFSRFPKEWRVLPFLDAVADATGGNAKIKVEDYLGAGVLPIVDQGQEQFNGYTDDPALACSAELPAIVFGDHTRRFKFIEEPFALGADGAKLLKPKEKFDPKFLYYYLNQLQIESAGYSRHYKFLKETYVPVPPLATQQHIARVLEQADQLRKQAQQVESELNQLAQSLFLEMFGDPISNPNGFDVVNIQEVVDIRDGTHDTPSYVEIGIPFVTSTHLCGDCIDFSTAPKITEADHRSFSKRSLVEDGDILFGMIGTIGNATLVRKDFEFSIKNVALFKPNHGKVNPYYLWMYLRNEKFLHHLFSTSGKGGTQKFVALGPLRAIDLMLPPRKEQEKFMGTYKLIHEQLMLIRNMKSEAENDFNALMQRAFNGELTTPERKAA